MTTPAGSVPGTAALRETGYRRDLVARAVMMPVDGAGGTGNGRLPVDIVVREEGAD